jgi:hypothetical protein
MQDEEKSSEAIVCQYKETVTLEQNALCKARCDKREIRENHI